MTHVETQKDNEEKKVKQYYHNKHLGSEQFVTDWKGRHYEHIEYTPYGELWIEETAPGVDKLPFRFTGKELDTETGLYYYGARYLDPRYSRWLSGDPALNDYIPKAGADTSKLPNGGAYNCFNFAVFGYGNNNPIKYNDPDGKTPKSYKVSDNIYIYMSSLSVIEGSFEAAYGFIPFGSFIPKGINYLFGFKTINSNDGIEKLKNIGSHLIDLTSIVGNSKTVADFLGSNAKFLKVAGKVLDVVSKILTAYDIYSQLSDNNGIGMEKIIDRLVGRELTSNSHENVSALYKFAKFRMTELIKNGDVKFTTAWDGSLTSYSWNAKAIKELREEIMFIKKLIE